MLLLLLGCVTEGLDRTGHTPAPTDSGSHDVVDTGSRDVVDTGAPQASRPAWRGTWVAQIKDMEQPASAHCQEGGWYRDDVSAMRTALLETGQNTYAGYIDDGDAADCWFLNLEDMLEAVTPEDDIAIFGAVKTGRTVEEYAAALGALRERAVEHPELQGLLIDDFFFLPQTVFSPGGQFSQADMATLASAAHDGAQPELALWTHIAGHAVGELLIPGVVLGAAHCEGCALLPGEGGLDADESWVELPLTASADSTPFAALLRNQLAYPRELVLDISLDGVVVESVLLDHNSAYALRQVSADLPTVPGADHTVRLTVRAVEQPSTDRIELSGFSLGGAWVTPSAVGVHRDAGRGMPDAALMAEETDSGHIVPWIDGVLLHYWDDPSQYDAAVLTHLYGATCEHLAAAGVHCVATMWGNNQWDFTMDRSQTVEKLTAAEALSDGVVVFRYPLDMHGHDGGVPPSQGVYREQAPFDEAYELMGAWPGYTRGIPGWSHTWRGTAACDGAYTLRWEDNDAITGRFRYSLAINGEEVLGVDVGDVAGAEQRTVSLAAGDEVAVVFAEIESVGNVTVTMQAAVDPPSGCPRLSWTHAASVDPEQAALYDCYAAWFRGEDLATACL